MERGGAGVKENSKISGLAVFFYGLARVSAFCKGMVLEYIEAPPSPPFGKLGKRSIQDKISG